MDSSLPDGRVGRGSERVDDLFEDGEERRALVALTGEHPEPPAPVDQFAGLTSGPGTGEELGG